MGSSRRTMLAGGLGLLWLVGMTALYYASHKPFSPLQAVSLLLAVVRLLVALGLVSLGGGLGRWVAQRWFGPPASPLEGLALQGALGLGLLAPVVMLAGVLGGYRPLIGWAVLLGLLALLQCSVRGWWSQAADLATTWRQYDGLGRALGGLCVVTMGATLLMALAPALSFDALVYHLALPSIYIQAGRFIYVPQIMFWGMPQTGEMLYTWAMLLAGGPAAAVLGWFSAFLAMAGLFGLLQRGAGVRAAWVGLAALLAGYTLAAEPSWAYVDWFAVLFGTAFLIALEQWQAPEAGTAASIRGRDRFQGQMLLLAGALAGMALGTKYTAGVLLPGGWLVIAWRHFGPGAARRGGPAVKDLAWFTLAAGLAFSPWALKNLLATGSPLYPLVFPAGAMSALRLQAYQWGRMWGDWQDVLLLPLRATYFGMDGGPSYGASLGALLFGLAPLAWLGWGEMPEAQRRLVRLAALVVAPGLVIWMALGRLSPYGLQARLYFAMFPALAALAGLGFAALGRISLPGVRLGRLAGALVFLSLFFTTFEIVTQTVAKGPASVLLAVQTSQEYLEANLGWHARAAQAVQELPETAQTLLLWEPRSLYCLPRCEPDEVLDRWLRERYGNSLQNKPRTADEILAGWRQAGYTHMLVHQAGFQFLSEDGRPPYREADWQAFNDFLNGLSPGQDFGGTYTLYRLEP